MKTLDIKPWLQEELVKFVRMVANERLVTDSFTGYPMCKRCLNLIIPAQEYNHDPSCIVIRARTLLGHLETLLGHLETNRD